MAVSATTARGQELLIDGFTTGGFKSSLNGASAGGPPDANGQPGVQFPAGDTAIFGGERDAQFWVGFGPDADQWAFGVDPARGLFWESDPGIHVNMVLEWDGSGDGTTFGGANAPDPLRLNATPYTGIRLEFAGNSDDLEILVTLGNKNVDDPTDTIPTGASQSPLVLVSGGRTDAFAVDIPFSSFTDPFAPFVPGADFADLNVIALNIGSAENITGNDFELRSVALVPEPASLTLLAAAGLGLLRRRHT